MHKHLASLCLGISLSFAALCFSESSTPGSALPREMLIHFFDLWKKSGFGHDPNGIERAAWIVQTSEGKFESIRWPHSGQRNSETWRDPIPRNVVAQAHTHPNKTNPKPSLEDRLCADRSKVPLYTLSKLGIWKVTPEGKITKEASRDWWIEIAREQIAFGDASVSAVPSRLLPVDSALIDEETNMKQKIASFTIFILVFCFGAFTFAADNNNNATCSNATVKGSYGLQRSGTTPGGPLASVGIVFYDGNGNLKSRQRTTVNGTHTSSVSTLEYRIAKDCTYKVFSGDLELATGVVVDNGNRIFLLSLAPGNTSYSVLEKIHK